MAVRFGHGMPCTSQIIPAAAQTACGNPEAPSGAFGVFRLGFSLGSVNRSQPRQRLGGLGGRGSVLALVFLDGHPPRSDLGKLAVDTAVVFDDPGPLVKVGLPILPVPTQGKPLSAGVMPASAFSHFACLSSSRN